MRKAAAILGPVVLLLVVALVIVTARAPDFSGDVLGDSTLEPAQPGPPLARLPRGVAITVTGVDDRGDFLCTITGPSRNCRTVAHDAAHASWSPDGTRIAFERENRSVRHGTYEASPDDIWVVNVGGSGERRLTRNPAEEHEPAWSPDGTRILFVSKRDGDPEIYVMNADGSGQRRVVRRPLSADRDVAWSPDGRKIAFVSTWAPPDQTDRESASTGALLQEEDDEGLIVVMRSNGTRVRGLRSGREPAWSPDGSRIVFERKGSDGTMESREIWIMDADGGHERRLTQGHLDQEPAWSPDGRWIAFERTPLEEGPTEVWAVYPEGTGLRRLTESGFTIATDPAWRPVRRSAR